MLLRLKSWGGHHRDASTMQAAAAISNKDRKGLFHLRTSPSSRAHFLKLRIAVSKEKSSDFVRVNLSYAEAYFLDIYSVSQYT